MSKDFKQRTAYKYLHGNLEQVPANIEKKWNRHNFDVGESRKKRIDKRLYDLNKLELND